MAETFEDVLEAYKAKWLSETVVRPIPWIEAMLVRAHDAGVAKTGADTAEGWRYLWVTACKRLDELEAKVEQRDAADSLQFQIDSLREQIKEWNIAQYDEKVKSVKWDVKRLQEQFDRLETRVSVMEPPDHGPDVEDLED